MHAELYRCVELPCAVAGVMANVQILLLLAVV